MQKTAKTAAGIFMTGLTVAAASATAWLFFRGASDYTLSFTTTNLYCVIWFAASVLSLYAGLLTASIFGLTASGLGFAAFAAVCMIDTDFCINCPGITRDIEIAAPLLIVMAWALITASSFKNPAISIRRTAWLWLFVGLTLVITFPAYNYSRYLLFSMRNRHLLEASANTMIIAQKLDAYRQAKGAYPETLEPAGVDKALVQLPYRGQTIKYFGRRSRYVLTFEDPILAGAAVYSWDPQKGGWYPIDPHECLSQTPHNPFLGTLNKISN